MSPAPEYTTLKDDIHSLDKRIALLEQKVENIDKNVQKLVDLLGTLAKVTGTAFIASVLAAVVSFVVRGGLAPN